ncbi:unnamed protein product [Amoebophrya sp. A25]|nr:unnamed protein product [Amoebophrya sp. A25]|eukprot:GSA25T00007907001.1
MVMQRERGPKTGSTTEPDLRAVSRLVGVPPLAPVEKVRLYISTLVSSYLHTFSQGITPLISSLHLCLLYLIHPVSSSVIHQSHLFLTLSQAIAAGPREMTACKMGSKTKYLCDRGESPCTFEEMGASSTGPERNSKPGSARIVKQQIF